MNNKLFSSALLFDDKRNIIYSAGLSIIIILLFSISFIMYPNIYSVQIHFSVLFFVPFTAAITLLTLYNNKETKYGYLMTQPVSRDSFIVTKTVGIILSYSIPFLIYILISGVLIAIKPSISIDIRINEYKYLFLNIFMLFSVTTFIVIVIQFMEMFFVNNIAAVAMPAAMFGCVLFEISALFLAISPKIEFVRKFLSSLFKDLVSTTGLIGIVITFFNYCYEHKFLGSLIFLFMSTLILIFTILINRKIKYENLSGIFTFDIIKNIFKVIVSFLIILFLESLLSLITILLVLKITGLSNINLSNTLIQIGEYVLLIINITWIPLTIFVYKFINKIEKKRMVA